MKILYVTPYPPLKNGIAHYAYYFKKAMEQHLGVQMDLLNIYENENIQTINRCLSLGKQVKFLEAIQRYDLIHFEIGVGQNREFYMLYFIKKYYPKLKTIITIHDPPLILSAPMSFIGLEHMPRAIRGVRKLFDLTVGKYWENKLLRSVDCIIVLTEKGRHAIEKRLKRDINYLPFVAYTKVSKIKQYRDRVNKILFFGYLGSKKGIDILIKSFAKFLSVNPECKDIKLYICGGSPENGGRRTRSYNHLLKLLNNLGISKNVIFTGRLSESQKDFYLKSSDILILPYRKQNRFGASAALIEGMSYGLPVIVSDVKSFSTDIKNGETGLLFEDGNVEMLAEKIELLVKNRGLRRRLGNNAREHILEEHNCGHVASKMKQIYENVLQGKIL